MQTIIYIYIHKWRRKGLYINLRCIIGMTLLNLMEHHEVGERERDGIRVGGGGSSRKNDVHTCFLADSSV